MKKSPYWRDENLWICPNHLPSVKIPFHLDRCWFANCSSVRPPNRPGAQPVKRVPPKTDSALCAWHKCAKGPDGGRAVARPNSKYCSRDCSNRNARWRHKNRGKP